jgi:hypothetical protein
VKLESAESEDLTEEEIACFDVEAKVRTEGQLVDICRMTEEIIALELTTDCNVNLMDLIIKQNMNQQRLYELMQVLSAIGVVRFVSPSIITWLGTANMKQIIDSYDASSLSNYCLQFLATLRQFTEVHQN